MDDWESLNPGPITPRHANDWGLVSFGIALAFLVMAPIQLIFNDFYWSIGRHRAAIGEQRMASLAGGFASTAFIALIIFAVAAGFKSRSHARSLRMPTAFASAGILIGLLDLVLWVGLTVNMAAILGLLS